MNGISPALRAAALAAALVAAGPAMADPTIAASPAIPLYGQPVSLELGSDKPYFLPSMRYTRQGNAITVEYETFSQLFGPYPPSIGTMPLDIGELPPGNYTVNARVLDADHPGYLLSSTTASLAVVPPPQYGVYPVPQAPNAYENVDVTMRSAAYFNPASLQVSSVSGNTIRVDFVFSNSLVGAPPAGWRTWGSVAVGALAPGWYHIEGWGRPSDGGAAQLYFTRDFMVAMPTKVVEFYNDVLDHYFMSAAPDEIAILESGGAGGGWKRTGQSFKAWLHPSEAAPEAKPVCRFYAKGPNSHFYTGDASECAQLRDLEATQRAQAQGQGKDFLGWAYEGIAFYALMPDSNGQCPAGSEPVWREYNGRALQNDSNHRFMTDSQVRLSMAGWSYEGVAFCSPP